MGAAVPVPEEERSSGTLQQHSCREEKRESGISPPSPLKQKQAKPREGIYEPRLNSTSQDHCTGDEVERSMARTHMTHTLQMSKVNPKFVKAKPRRKE